MPIKGAHKDQLPNPSRDQRDTDGGQPQKGPLAAVPVLIVQDLLEAVASRDLGHDRTERQEAPGPQVVVVGIDRARKDQEALGREEGRDHGEEFPILEDFQVGLKLLDPTAGLDAEELCAVIADDLGWPSEHE